MTMATTAAPEKEQSGETEPAPENQPPQGRGRRTALAGGGLSTLAMGVGHFFGLPGMLIASGVTGGGLLLWRLPQMRKHFAHPAGCKCRRCARTSASGTVKTQRTVSRMMRQGSRRPSMLGGAGRRGSQRHGARLGRTGSGHRSSRSAAGRGSRRGSPGGPSRRNASSRRGSQGPGRLSRRPSGRRGGSASRRGGSSRPGGGLFRRRGRSNTGSTGGGSGRRGVFRRRGGSNGARAGSGRGIFRRRAVSPGGNRRAPAWRRGSSRRPGTGDRKTGMARLRSPRAWLRPGTKPGTGTRSAPRRGTGATSRRARVARRIGQVSRPARRTAQATGKRAASGFRRAARPLRRAVAAPAAAVRRVSARNAKPPSRKVTARRPVRRAVTGIRARYRRTRRLPITSATRRRAVLTRRWRRWQERRRAAPQAGGAVTTPPVSNTTVPREPAADNRQPGQAIHPNGTTPRKKTSMNGTLEPLTEAIHEHLAGWRPENHQDANEFFKTGLPSMFEALGAALSSLSESLASERPLDPAVTDTINEMGSVTGSYADVARELGPLYDSAHEKEIERIENPRPGEEMWDVRA